MKNLIYVGVIAACILVAVVMFLRKGDDSLEVSDTEMMWVKCLRCGEGYEMSLKQYYEEAREKTLANPSPMPVTLPLTCQKCSKDGIVKAHKCEKCGEIFREASVPGDLPDRCPKCKHSATEARRKANQAAQQ